MPVEKTDIHVVVIGHVDSAEKPVSTAPVINSCQGDRIETPMPSFGPYKNWKTLLNWISSVSYSENDLYKHIASSYICVYIILVLDLII